MPIACAEDAVGCDDTPDWGFGPFLGGDAFMAVALIVVAVAAVVVAAILIRRRR